MRNLLYEQGEAHFGNKYHVNGEEFDFKNNHKKLPWKNKQRHLQVILKPAKVSFFLFHGFFLFFGGVSQW